MRRGSFDSEVFYVHGAIFSSIAHQLAFLEVHVAPDVSLFGLLRVFAVVDGGPRQLKQVFDHLHGLTEAHLGLRLRLNLFSPVLLRFVLHTRQPVAAQHLVIETLGIRWRQHGLESPV